MKYKIRFKDIYLAIYLFLKNILTIVSLLILGLITTIITFSLIILVFWGFIQYIIHAPYIFEFLVNSIHIPSTLGGLITIGIGLALLLFSVMVVICIVHPYGGFLNYFENKLHDLLEGSPVSFY